MRIVLIICGGIAAYKSLDLIRKLRNSGMQVRPVLTKAGAQFVTPLSVSTLAEERVFEDLFSLTDENEIGHIEIAKETDIIVSIATTLGSTGVVVQNTLFKKFKLNMLYKPLAIAESSLSEAISAIKVFNLKGCAISMPFKEIVVDQCDYAHPLVIKTNSANTIINNSGKLYAYNTDVFTFNAPKTIFKIPT